MEYKTASEQKAVVEDKREETPTFEARVSDGSIHSMIYISCATDYKFNPDCG